MIYVMNIRDINAAQYDEVWAIMRSVKGAAQGVKQVKELSPSPELFQKYLRLKDAGRWNAGTFRSIYVPEFIKGIKASTEAKIALNTLWKLDRAGKKIAIGCSCYDEGMCHRSIVAGLLQGVGCNVSCKADYTGYYRMYMGGEAQPQAAAQPAAQDAAPAFRGERFYLSNMYAAPVRFTVGGTEYLFKCSEAAYQACKYWCAVEENHVDPSGITKYAAADGFTAKALIKEIKSIRLNTWHEKSLQSMRDILVAKFAQHPELYAKLMAEAEPIIERNTWGDTFWGTCNGSGENHLGRLLTDIKNGTRIHPAWAL